MAEGGDGPVDEVDEGSTEGHRVPPLSRAGAAIRGVAIDLTPLRISRDYRLLWSGQLISLTGSQITVVALPYQIFRLTGSSLAVGMIGLVQIVPLIVFSMIGGAVADRIDRRKLILGTEFGLAATSGLLLAGALGGHPPLWYLYAVAAVQAGFQGVNAPTRSATVPNLVPRELLPAALALNQVLFNTSLIVGPAAGGLILARLGLTWAYGIDVASFLSSITATLLLRPQPPRHEGGVERTSGWRSIRQSFAYLRGRRVLVSTFLIDLDAMIFGMPRAVFPALALTVFHVGPQGLGLLYAAPAVGAVAGAVTTGWIGRVRHQGRAVIWAVTIWGLAITAFGFSTGLFGLSLALLAVAGAADVISAVFRGTILQLSVPDDLRGRLTAIHIMVVTGGPRLGDVEAGVIASLVSPTFSVVSGGIACVLGVAVLAARVPELWQYHADRSGGTSRGP